MNKFFKYGVTGFILILVACQSRQETLFQLRDIQGVDFRNTLSYTEDFNPYTYRNFYNGGGVALGDFNQDGLIDVYLTGNLDENKLLLNEGNWQFKDITAQAGVACPDVWSTGATFVDINGDKLLDLYVCKSGKPGGANRHNELFVNQGDGTFKEESKKYGLDFVGLSVHAGFFDYDNDGDLDCYLLTNSLRSVGGFDLKKGLRDIPDSEGNKFLENRNDSFVDVTLKTGIYSSRIGYGLGITLSDFNWDGWTDMFISNDFFERDYYYLNNGDGSFRELGDQLFNSFSMGSMGADAADLNNDQLADLFVTEMLPDSLNRKKTKAVYDSWNKFQSSVDNGYHYQYPRNVLHRNLGNDGFLEIGRYSGVAASDWSWASLLFDADNDGLKDIFVSNGILKDLLDRDYLAFIANEDVIRNMISNRDEEVIMKLIDAMPSKAMKNKFYQNRGNFQFKDVSEIWGINKPTFSNGSAYADLDNDGDLDLVVNNIDMPVHFYENKSETNSNHSVSILLKGKGRNTQAIGAKVIVVGQNGGRYFTENYITRGFQSSISNQLTIGIGQNQKIDSLIVIWPNGNRTVKINLATNQMYVIEEQEQKTDLIYKPVSLKNKNEAIEPFTFVHQENSFNDFNRERLLYKMNSNEGPGMAVGDVNNDQINDVFIGGAKNQESLLYLSLGAVYKEVRIPFDKDYRAEVVDAIFFDSDNDGDLDLYVAHGGKAFSIYAPELNDKLYINSGGGVFTEVPDFIEFPERVSTGTVLALDYNKDGLSDIIIGERYKTSLYGQSGSVFLFQNLGNNKFEFIPQPEFENIGMIKSMEWGDLDGDSIEELVIAGEWMPLKIFKYKNGSYRNVTKQFGIENKSGLWNVVKLVDVDQDGDLDLIAGNTGSNNFLTKGTRMYINDFDNNGSMEQIITVYQENSYYPIHDMDDLIQQIPSLKKKTLYYKDYSNSTMKDLFGSDILSRSKILELNQLKTQLYINNNGILKEVELPEEIQYSSTHAIEIIDINDDGILDICSGGNDYLVKPQYGRNDASKGWILYGSMDKNVYLIERIESLGINGQIRKIDKLNNNQIIIAINNQKLRVLDVK